MTPEGTKFPPRTLEVGDELEDVWAALGVAEEIELAPAMLAVVPATPEAETSVANVVVAVDDCVAASSCEHGFAAAQKSHVWKHLPEGEASSSSSSGCAPSGHPVVHGSSAQQPVQTS